MDKITEHSPKRLIVVDAVEALAEGLFGDAYEYELVASATYDPLELIHKLEKAKWITILGDEASELYDLGGTIRNEVLVNVLILAPVPSPNLAHTIPYLEHVEIMKHNLIGCEIEHKGHVIYGDVQSEAPAWWSDNDIEHIARALRIRFAIVLRIDDDRS